jgi:prepilin-type N-terminal cleavage/methylation domain-containing protein
MGRQSRCGFTLVELLVVITIIGILMSLMLPAVQSVREAARRAVCSNNLKQLGLGCLQHEQAQGFFPTGGWNWTWAGDPDRGFTEKQPGGWFFNVLPYIELKSLHDMGANGHNKDALGSGGGADRAQTPVAVFTCPTRHKVMAFPYVHSAAYINIAEPTPVIGRSDYAANSGEGGGDPGQGASSYAQGDSMSDVQWEQTWGFYPTPYTGVIYRRSMVKMAQIKHGASLTYLIGERYLDPDDWLNGVECANDQGWDEGYDYDTDRWTGSNGAVIAATNPMRDTPGVGGCDMNFGSAHPDSFSMVMCDGSVHKMSFNIDTTVHRRLGRITLELPLDHTTPIDMTVVH